MSRKVNSQLKAKLEKLKRILKELDSVVIAFSGGLDSTFLLKIARDVLGKDKVLAVTAYSRTYPKMEYNLAKDLAKRLDVKHITVYTKELENSSFRKNTPWRCFYCKDELFRKLNLLAQAKGYQRVLDGTNYEDEFDYRPGRKASKKWNILSPLKEVRLRKNEIRLLARNFGLPNWDKPPQACLSSRIPYYTEITPAKLERIEKAEDFLYKKGFKQVRVRFYEHLARIEVGKEEIRRFLNSRLCREVIRKFKKLGFKYITLDLEGYRTGSMNETFK